MFDIGFWEIALILVLALVILGPERLPHAARTVGRFVGKARRYVEGVKTEVEKEFDTGELKRMLHNQEVQIRELQGKLTEGSEELNRDALGQFNDDDPGNGHQAQAAESNYEMFEESDDGYDELEVNRKPVAEETADNSIADKSAVTETTPTEKPV